MAGFYLFSSNRQEALIQQLAETLQNNPLPNPLTPELIMVQNHGMQRWVSLELARINGIEANTKYLFPNELLQISFQEIIPNYQAPQRQEEDLLIWKIMEILPSLLDQSQFALLRHYLEGDQPLKAFQLAKRIAGLFDQYSMFRPEMLLEWENSEKGDWQAELWRHLPQEIRDRQKPKLREQFHQHFAAAFQRPNKIPLRVSIFGISSLPPLHVDILNSLAEHVEIYLFFLNPTDMYWGDILSDKEILKQVDRYNRLAEVKKKYHESVDEEELYFDTGNALLASLGKFGKEFFQLMIEQNLMDAPGEAGFEEPEAGCLLECIQRDIFRLENPAQEQLDLEDRSLQIHSCHSPMREVEVLLDQLLYLMDQDPNLKPSDILVMTPDIESYAPLIHSVFGGTQYGGRAFPFSIADRGIRQESKVIQYFIKLLELPKGRFTVTDVFELLESEPIRNLFHLTDDEVTMIRGWVQKANIRWGIDAAFREKMGTPATYETTWEFGIDRILTGYAMPGEEQLLFQDILPFDDIEGNNAAVFGRFLEFYERLKALLQPGKYTLERSRSLADWATLFRDLVRLFFQEDETWSRELELLRGALEGLKSFGDIELKVDISVISSFLIERLDDSARKMGFLGFGVTFCSMMPMRSIPFQVIALLGMNDKAFPRIIRPLSFDLMQLDHRLGDRSLKDEDRYLFLETLLSTRQVLYISYVGQSIKDNTSLTPSTLVTELIHYVEQGYEIEGKTIPEHLVTKHPLQPFNPKYFQKNSELFSYSQENLHAANHLNQDEARQAPQFEVELPPIDDEFLEVNVTSLVRFFDQPAAYLFKNRLKAYLDKEEALPEEEEPFLLGALENYSMQARLVEALLEKSNAQDQKKIFKAMGTLPLAQVGELTFEHLHNETESFVHQVAPYLQEEKLPPFTYEFDLGEFHVQGVITAAYQNGLFYYRPSRVKVKDRLRIWLEQLILNYLQPSGYPLSATLIGKEKKSGDAEIFSCASIDHAEDKLKLFLDYYRQGLSSPLAFFPRTANQYVETFLLKEDQEKAQTAALGTWLGNDNFPGEWQQNPYFQRCFKEHELFKDNTFERILTELLIPVYTMQVREG
ncbi:MAG: exodeoxyribonuclease V subunit gamma [SAR324 cluster bacterium]|uniref:Exodeoxyribonuclease V subunit gamma n=1 Tax=SAR324 cluster bacterium TaxID=2024889 RepID=A0A2A4T1C9_9DELT|nr:MAG: exodeoxyribonuclease V subunit gamma [SAR324 cluster bacterium]